MSNQNQPNNNNVQNNQNQKQAQQIQSQQLDLTEIISRQQMLIEGLAADRDALFKNSQDLTAVIKQMKDELVEVKASLKEEKLRAQLQQEAEQKALALVESFKTAVEAGGVPGLPAVNGGTNNSGSYDRLHYLFKFGDKRRRGIF